MILIFLINIIHIVNNESNKIVSSDNYYRNVVSKSYSISLKITQLLNLNEIDKFNNYVIDLCSNLKTYLEVYQNNRDDYHTQPVHNLNNEKGKIIQKCLTLLYENRDLGII